jgi:hypothetical protein
MLWNSKEAVRMAPSFHMYCYPWDLDDEGVEAAVGALAGQVGVDALSVAASLPGIREYRGREFGGRRLVECDAAIHFQPTAACYQNTRIRPAVAAWMKSRNPLEKITGEAARQGLGVRAWVACCDNDVLAARYPAAGCVDVFGDPIGGWLCPSNPDVREYVGGLVQDLSTNYPLQVIELGAAHFGGGDGGGRRVVRGVEPNGVQRSLLMWCFCASCRERARQAGVDVDAVADKMKALLAAMYRVEPSALASTAALLGAHADLLAYHRMRVAAVGSLVEFGKSRAPRRMVVRLPDARPEALACGLDVAAVREHCDAVCLSLPSSSDVAAQQPFESAVAGGGGAGRVEVAMDCHPPRFQDGPALVAEVKRLATHGHAAVGFANYGVAPAPCLDWVRQAIRFARREGEG